MKSLRSAQATYLKLSDNDKEALGQYEDFTLMMMHTDFLKCKVKENAQGLYAIASN
jgi:hypothetical protein